MKTSVFQYGPGIILEKYDKNIVDIQNEGGGHKFAARTVYQIGIQLIEMIEKLHSIGFIHNDIRPKNIYVDHNNKLKLINFSKATPYIKDLKTFREPNGSNDHIEVGYKNFKGDIRFCSPNHLKKKQSSRRDDCFSVMYIILYLLTEKIPFEYEDMQNEDNIRRFIVKKCTEAPRDFCGDNNYKNIEEFVREIYSYHFRSKPEYSKLKFLLEREILLLNEIPS